MSGGTQVPNQSVIAPIADQLSNSGNAGITYQFAANSMVGASGTFTNLHYPDQAEVPGLFDSASQGGLVFYSARVSRINYFGATYQYQRLLSYPAPGTNETQTHALLLFYTMYPTKRFSISVFGGPQYADVGPQFSDTVATPPTAAFRSWNPSAGGSLGWQGHLSSLAISYAHLISNGGGLIGAVKMDNVSASIRQQLRRTLSATVAGGYAENDLLAAAPLTSGNGHTVSGTASLQQLFRAAPQSCNWDTRDFIRITAQSPSWPRLPTPIANSFQFPISSPDPWEGNLWLTISKRKVRKVLTFSVTWALCAAATCSS